VVAISAVTVGVGVVIGGASVVAGVGVVIGGVGVVIVGMGVAIVGMGVAIVGNDTTALGVGRGRTRVALVVKAMWLGARVAMVIKDKMGVVVKGVETDAGAAAPGVTSNILSKTSAGKVGWVGVE
jgi:hypothetical protein